MIQGTTNNPHIAEERVMNGTENGIGEEEKYDNCHIFGCLAKGYNRYSAVVRAPGAYVPPGARRHGSGPTPTQANFPPASPGPTSTQAPATNGTTAPVPTISTPSEDAAAKVCSLIRMLGKYVDSVPSLLPKGSLQTLETLSLTRSNVSLSESKPWSRQKWISERQTYSSLARTSK